MLGGEGQKGKDGGGREGWREMGGGEGGKREGEKESEGGGKERGREGGEIKPPQNLWISKFT